MQASENVQRTDEIPRRNSPLRPQPRVPFRWQLRVVAMLSTFWILLVRRPKRDPSSFHLSQIPGRHYESVVRQEEIEKAIAGEEKPQRTLQEFRQESLQQPSDRSLSDRVAALS